MKQMTIGKKLFLSCGAALVLTLALGVIALEGLATLGSAVKSVVGVTARAQFLAGELDTAQSDLTALERGVLLRSYMKDPATVDKYNQQYQETAAGARKAMDEFVPLVETAEGKRLLEDLRTAVDNGSQAHEELYRLARDGQADAATQIYTARSLPILKQGKTIADRLLALEGELMARTARDAGASASAVRWMTGIVTGLALLVAVLVVFIVRGTSRSLQQAAAELGENAEQVAGASDQVSSSSQALAQGASEQAASIEETSASSEEITSMTHRNADNSRTAAELMGQTAQVIEEANRTLGQMEVSMREINAASDKVGKIIKVIDEIAFQTNILALNAAVEAARAGEAGMGFAVVADEVRNLAQRSAQAAKDTASLIEESIAKSSEGRAKVDQVGAAIRGITETAQKVKTLVDEVKLGSEEQARGIDQISKAISQMEQVTQKAAANAEETASAGAEMRSLAGTMKTVVGRVARLVGSSDGTGRSRHARQAQTPPLASGAGRPARSGSAADLRALHGAIGASVGATEKAPAHVTAANNRSAIPMDDDFKEF
jgi:methyl-accepting chemotaxis protein/methyl-accepting chemotaxis protein-1 (serine sensor receptor)